MADRGRETYDDRARGLISALKQSYEQGDDMGVVAAYRQLTQLILKRVQGNENKSMPKNVLEHAVPAGRFYEVLGIEPLASTHDVHVGYLRNIKKLMGGRQLSANNQDREFLGKLEELCLAHDVLKEPQTRVDYDFRLLKVRGGGNALADELDALEKTNPKGRVHLKIGELLQSSEIIDMSELAAAVDMHKAMPEMLFGQFMVKSGFINQIELDTVLLAQKLIGDGNITVAQFQEAMRVFKDQGVPFLTFVKQEGWVEDVAEQPQ